MHVPINLNSPNNISEWQKGFNSAFKGLKHCNSSNVVVLYFAIKTRTCLIRYSAGLNDDDSNKNTDLFVN